MYWSQNIFVLFDPYVRFLNFSSVGVTEWQPIVKKLLSRLTLCFLGISA